jgi:uncharacterized protein YcfL
MKKISVVLFVILLLIGCGSHHQLSPEGYKISSITDTSKCQFVKNAYFEARASTMIYYAQVNTEMAGGDSYKILNISNEYAMGVNIQMVNIEVWKCK